MNKKVLKVLEFDKILALISEIAVCEQSKNTVLKLMPSGSFDEVLSLQKETSQASSMIAMFGSLPVAPVKSVAESVKRAEIGGILSPKELLNVGALLRVSRQVSSYLSKTEKFDILTSYGKQIVLNNRLATDITDAIISEEIIADSASPQLAAIRRK
ncbi:MAG: hypothetical protein WCX81_06940, partial [Monoglobales bacterium]